MKVSWQKAFSRTKFAWKDESLARALPLMNHLRDLKEFLDYIHIRHCLLRPYCEVPDYPPVEPRELLPSFEADLWEHKLLPGFSLVALERPLDYFSEVFQYDNLHSVHDITDKARESAALARNTQLIQSRLPRRMQDKLRAQFSRTDVTSLTAYPALLPFLLEMDRAQVMALQENHSKVRHFHLAGIFASLPSDLDTEIKRYGLRINRFSVGDNIQYERNRSFVYQHLMELYGFPVVSERRTSAALFARRLHKIGEKFLIRVLGQSDRTLTTIWNDAENRQYPRVEKIALVALDPDQEEVLGVLRKGRYLVDTEKRIVIMRVRYRQHRFDPDNVRQERALSMEAQEVIHPITGKVLTDVNILRDTSNMFLRLNDIVRGDYTGRIIYKRNELVENTDSEEKRLKFLYAWLSKHQRRIIGYGDEFFGNISKVLDTYLLSPERFETFSSMNDLYQEVIAKYSYIQQARKIRLLEDLRDRQYKGTRISYHQMLVEVVKELHSLKFEVVSYFDTLVSNVIAIGEKILNDSYLTRNYIEKRDETLSRRGHEIRRNYGKLVSLVDEFKAIRKARTDTMQRGASATAEKR